MKQIKNIVRNIKESEENKCIINCIEEDLYY